MYKMSESRETELVTQGMKVRTNGTIHLMDPEMAAIELENLLDLASIFK